MIDLFNLFWFFIIWYYFTRVERNTYVRPTKYEELFTKIFISLFLHCLVSPHSVIKALDCDFNNCYLFRYIVLTNQVMFWCVFVPPMYKAGLNWWYL